MKYRDLIVHILDTPGHHSASAARTDYELIDTNGKPIEIALLPVGNKMIVNIRQGVHNEDI